LSDDSNDSIQDMEAEIALLREKIAKLQPEVNRLGKGNVNLFKKFKFEDNH
jgi:uncharacterized small protein (DUF1192 family)